MLSDLRQAPEELKEVAVGDHEGLAVDFDLDATQDGRH